MKSEKFFRKSDWIAFLVCFFVSLTVYVLTLQPTVGLEDSGELIVASDYLGVPHPPGYPIWTLMTWFFQWVFHTVTFHGHPNPAWAVNLFSAVAGAAACGVLALLISRSGMDLLRSMKKESTMLGEKTESLFCAAAGISAGLLLAFAQGMWSQSVIAEVYSLNIFFQTLVLLFLYRWISTPKQTHWLFLCAFTLGLGITNHQTIMLMGLAVAIAILFRDLRLFRDFAIVGVVLLGFIIGSSLVESYATGLTEKINLMTSTAAKIKTTVVQQGWLNSHWGKGWHHAGFWLFLIGIVSTPILLAVNPKPRTIAIITACFALLFIGTDLRAKHQFKEHRELVEKAKTTALTNAEHQKMHKTRNGQTMLISRQEISLNKETHILKGFKNPTFNTAVLFLFLVPGLLFLRLPNGKIVCATILALFAGLAFYLYMPFSSDQNPPINWGYPRTWQGFMHAITRGQYERVHLSNVLGNPGHFVLQIKSFLGDLRTQFLIPVVLVGFLPFTSWKLKIAGKQINGFLAATVLLIPAAGLIVIQKLLEIKYPGGDYEILAKISTPLMLVMFLLSSIGFALSIVNFVHASYRKCRELIMSGLVWDKIAVLPMLLLATGLVLTSTKIAIDLITALVKTGDSNATWVNYSIAACILLPPVLLAIAFVLKRNTSTALRFDINEDGQHWFITTMVAFVAVGVVFVILQNPKTDIQSLFIGRVQYIQSHAIYALWLGYGLLLLGAYTEVLFKNNRIIRYLLTIGILVLPAVLIVKNKYYPDQLKIYGGAEQGGHDFGWQFGNWQLQGVDGIEEDMRAWYSPEEFEKQWAAYPNKNYPQPMGPNAIFFGGTDPGRFVPTYMIYSAKVRQDVYLITQNALADNTYMNVMRDLYGDQIWIPSPIDSNMAFQKYIEGVRSGKIQAGADVKTEGGKVQVQGVGGVMKINGFLSQWIFEHNQYLTETKTDEATRPTGAVVVHADPVIDPTTGKPPLRTFYVEESYVLPWMYPYLTPNGLIMKINNKPTPLTPELIKNDTEFWNWNCDRLLGDEKFIRDIVARKTFSKLRSALAGLYAARGKPREAEAAFRQAIDLYDLSPEANMRLADLIARQGRFDEASALFDVLLEKDSNNEKARVFQNRIQQMKGIGIQRQQLEQKLKSGKIEFIDSMQLISIYLQTGQPPRADALAKQMLASNTMTPPMLMQLAQHMARGNRLPVVELILKKYTTIQPRDPAGWINLAALQMALKKGGEMWVSIDKAIEVGGESARNTLRTDKRFDSIRNTKEFKKRIPPPAKFNLLPPGLGTPGF